MAVDAWFVDCDITIKWTEGTIIRSYDMTEQVSAVEVKQEATELDRSTFGNDGWKVSGRGLKKGSVKLDFFTNFTPDGVFDTFDQIWNTDTGEFTIEIDGPDNTKVVAPVVMTSMPSFAGKIDEDNKTSITFPGRGAFIHTVAT